MDYLVIIFLIYGFFSLFIFSNKIERDNLSPIRLTYEIFFNGVCGVVGWSIIQILSNNYIIDFPHIFFFLIGLLGITFLLPRSLYGVAHTSDQLLNFFLNKK